MAGEPTFPLTIGPTIGAGRDTKPRVLVAEFGDGFIQRAGDGVNALSDEFSLTWVNLTQAEVTSANQFLRDRAGHEAFLWTPPREVSPRKFICPSWNVTFEDGQLDGLRATFKEVHDL